MKKIILIRHAKAVAREEWKAADFDRPLVKKGKKQSKRICKMILPFLESERWIVSPSCRTKETAEIMVKVLKKSVQIVEEALLYDTSKDSYFSVLKNIPEEQDSILLIGHNPMISDLANWLCSNTKGAFFLPIGGALLIEGNWEKWADTENGGGVLRWMIIPKLAKE